MAMFHSGGARSAGGNLSPENQALVALLLDQFIESVARIVEVRSIRRAMVRSCLSCSLIVVLDSQNVWVAAEKQSGMPTTMSFDHSTRRFTANEILEAAQWEFGFDAPFVIGFPSELLGKGKEDRVQSIEAIAMAHVESELQRVQKMMQVIPVNPIFGPVSYAVDPHLAFVLMPFTDELTRIFNAVIKPSVESAGLELVCRRADDIKSNRAIIQDIWKSICESRVVIADITGFNPNVMYELGIAHTLGKETILINQTSEDVKFPFDLAHIRRIEYLNDAVGGQKLAKELAQTLTEILSPSLRAT
jgi:hypothetical protein